MHLRATINFIPFFVRHRRRSIKSKDDFVAKINLAFVAMFLEAEVMLKKSAMFSNFNYHYKQIRSVFQSET